MVIFQNLSENGEMLKNVGENIKNNCCTDLLLHPAVLLLNTQKSI